MSENLEDHHFQYPIVHETVLPRNEITSGDFIAESELPTNSGSTYVRDLIAYREIRKDYHDEDDVNNDVAFNDDVIHVDFKNGKRA